MADTLTSTNMSLPIPIVGQNPGPQYATDLNSCLTIIDGHDHASGQGVPVTPAGININSDLSFGQNNATQLRSVRFYAQSAALSDPADLACLYVVGDDLYYNDGLSNQIRITQSGNVAGTPGSIANLVSPASASYVSMSSTFVFQSGVNTAGNIDGASLLMRNSTASSFALTLSPPNAMGSNFSLVLPTLPGSGTKFVSLDSSGNLGATWDVDNSTLEISSSVLQVKNAGITRAKLAALGQQVAASSGLDSNLTTSFVTIPFQSVSIAVSSRPVMIMMQPDGAASNGAYIDVTVSSSAVVAAWIRLRRDSTEIARWTVGLNQTSATGSPFVRIPACLCFVDVSPGTGTVAYSFQFALVSATGSPSVEVSEVKTIAFILG